MPMEKQTPQFPELEIIYHKRLSKRTLQPRSNEYASSHKATLDPELSTPRGQLPGWSKPSGKVKGV